MTLAFRSGLRVPSDPWVDAAAAVRHAALMTEGVAGLSESAVYQTLGPGQAVRGVGVTRGETGHPQIEIGVIVDAEVAADRDRLSGACRRVRAAAESAWARSVRRDHEGHGVAVVRVHVVDVSHAPEAQAVGPL